MEGDARSGPGPRHREGAVKASSCHTSHGPGGIRSGSSVSTARHPISARRPLGSPLRRAPGPAAGPRSTPRERGHRQPRPRPPDRRSGPIHPTHVASRLDSSDPITTSTSNDPAVGRAAAPGRPGTPPRPHPASLGQAAECAGDVEFAVLEEGHTGPHLSFLQSLHCQLVAGRAIYRGNGWSVDMAMTSRTLPRVPMMTRCTHRRPA